MRRWACALGLAAVAVCGQSYGQTCATYPNTLTNGSTADANQVMANFNCAALLGSARFTGNVGILNSSPANPLDVGGVGRFVSPNNGTTGGVIIRDTAGNPNTNYLQFVDNTNAIQYGYIQGLKTSGLTLGGGNVGIGTTGPSTLLSLGPAVSGIKLALYDGGASSLYGIGAQNGELTFGANLSATATPQMVLSNTGSVGIGTTTPGSDVGMTNGGLTINGTGGTQLTVQQNGTSGFALNTGAGNWAMFDKNGGVWHTSLTSQGGDVGVAGWAPGGYALYSNGAAGGTTAWTNASDARLKQNVTEITGALDLVMRLRGVRFDWRPGDKREVGKALPLAVGTPQLGFIAQEVQAVAPEAVVAPKDPTKDIYSLQETKLIPILVEAMKEQQSQIAKLEAKVARLEAAATAQRPAGR